MAGVKRKNPFDESECDLTREESEKQNVYKRTRFNADSVSRPPVGPRSGPPLPAYVENDAALASLISNYTSQPSPEISDTANGDPQRTSSAPLSTLQEGTTSTDLDEIRVWNTVSYRNLNSEQRELSDIIRKQGDLRPMTKSIGARGTNLIRRMAISRDWLDAPFIELPLSGQSGTQPRTMRMGAGRKPNTPIPDPEDWAKAHGLILRGRNLLCARGYFYGTNGISKRSLVEDIARQCRGYRVSQNVITKAETSARKDILGKEEAFRWSFKRWVFGTKTFPLEGSVRPVINQPLSFIRDAGQNSSRLSRAIGQDCIGSTAGESNCAKGQPYLGYPQQQGYLTASSVFPQPMVNLNGNDLSSGAMLHTPGAATSKSQVTAYSVPPSTHLSSSSGITGYTGGHESTSLARPYSRVPRTHYKTSKYEIEPQSRTSDILLQQHTSIHENKARRERAGDAGALHQRSASNVGVNHHQSDEQRFHNAQAFNAYSSFNQQASTITKDEHTTAVQCSSSKREFEPFLDESTRPAVIKSINDTQYSANHQSSNNNLEPINSNDVFARQQEQLSHDNFDLGPFRGNYLAQNDNLEDLYSQFVNDCNEPGAALFNADENLRSENTMAKAGVSTYSWADYNFLFEDESESLRMFDEVIQAANIQPAI